MNNTKLLSLAVEASIKAGKAVLDIYTNGFDIEYKDDNSPLTTADKKAHSIINDFLQKTDYPILSEEGASISYEERKTWDTFWIVDPLDGTKEFIKKNGEFTINIALIKNAVPILGVIYVPVTKTLYFASKDTGSYKTNNISEFSSFDIIKNSATALPTPSNSREYTIVASRSHINDETKQYIQKKKKTLKNIIILSQGSSLKLCMIAENKADVYPRFGPTMEWDIAAGHAIIKYAGGEIIDYTTQQELKYNKQIIKNPWFIAKTK